MEAAPHLVLVVGATGTIGRHVVQESLKLGYATRALVRDISRTSSLPTGTDIAVGDLTDIDSLVAAVDGVDAVVFTHGSNSRGRGDGATVDYGGVRNVLSAIGDRPVSIALMSAMGITNFDAPYNRSTGMFQWKLRAERLVRLSGQRYTIVRPGWFDYNAPDELQLKVLQGDRRRTGTPSDGPVSRLQIAAVLLASLRSEAAVGKTFELLAERGPVTSDLEPLFAGLRGDTGLDGIEDDFSLPMDAEPQSVREDFARYTTS